MRVKLVVAYDGTDYCGWQVQPNGITIEEVLNQALSDLFGQPITVLGASRTDAGVHARGNVAVFDVDTRMPAEKISYALNQRLPEDVVVQSSDQVEADFHPRFQKTTKTYEYQILNRTFPDPLLRRYTYFYHHSLDVAKMQQAAAYLVGEHDFTSFASVHSQTNTFIRTVYDLGVERTPDDVIHIRITGNGFLYNMVRIIAGTLIQVGAGMIEPETVKEILAGCDRELAGPTAPAQGLTLIEIRYDNKKNMKEEK
jgi:tRNA pseudouridine38-40 synthase